MKIAAIIPVKTFSNAKSRLRLPASKKEELCKIMFNEVIKAIMKTNIINKIVIVSKSKDIISDEMVNVIHINDKYEIGVNNAISIADKYVLRNGFDASVVFPQDIPLIKPVDVISLLKWQAKKLVCIVPSKRFDGTNALVRMPTNLMKTHYDEDSYKIHLQIGKRHTNNTSLVLIKRIMFDVDNHNDLKLLLKQTDKPEICKAIRNIIY
ncbi:MAG: 2-phospho-L-lactate guanylyltransferase [Thaumarchaeota archaeon]|nr:2-phospho-L-lactate guanylyltransferase [Nitrososphaerota archaeon]